MKILIRLVVFILSVGLTCDRVPAQIIPFANKLKKDKDIKMKKTISLFTLALGVLAGHGQTFYPTINTDAYPQGTYQSITVGDTYGTGITATYTVSSGYINLDYLPSDLNGGPFANVNGPTIYNSTQSATFNAAFSANISEFLINFAADGRTGSTIMNAAAYENGVLVGSQNFATTLNSGPQGYDEGQIDFASSTPFNKVVVSLAQNPSIAPLWAIGADAYGTGTLGGGAPTPEPGTLALAGLGLGGLVAARRKK